MSRRENVILEWSPAELRLLELALLMLGSSGAEYDEWVMVRARARVIEALGYGGAA